MDIVEPTSVTAAFEKIREQVGNAQLAAAVYNVGAGYVVKPFLELSLKEYTGGFESNAVGFFNFAQATLPLLGFCTSFNASANDTCHRCNCCAPRGHTKCAIRIREMLTACNCAILGEGIWSAGRTCCSFNRRWRGRYSMGQR